MSANRSRRARSASSQGVAGTLLSSTTSNLVAVFRLLLIDGALSADDVVAIAAAGVCCQATSFNADEAFCFNDRAVSATGTKCELIISAVLNALLCDDDDVAATAVGVILLAGCCCALLPFDCFALPSDGNCDS